MPVHVPPLDCRGCLRYTCKRSGSLAQKGRIERSIASPGHRTFSGCQAFKNVTLTRYHVLAKLRCISITHAHDIIGRAAHLGESLSWFFFRHSSMLLASIGTPVHCF